MFVDIQKSAPKKLMRSVLALDDSVVWYLLLCQNMEGPKGMVHREKMWFLFVVPYFWYGGWVSKNPLFDLFGDLFAILLFGNLATLIILGSVPYYEGRELCDLDCWSMGLSLNAGTVKWQTSIAGLCFYIPLFFVVVYCILHCWSRTINKHYWSWSI